MQLPPITQLDILRFSKTTYTPQPKKIYPQNKYHYNLITLSRATNEPNRITAHTLTAFNRYPLIFARTTDTNLKVKHPAADRPFHTHC